MLFNIQKIKEIDFDFFKNSYENIKNKLEANEKYLLLITESFNVSSNSFLIVLFSCQILILVLMKVYEKNNQINIHKANLFCVVLLFIYYLH